MLGCLKSYLSSTSLSTLDFEVYPREGSLTGVVYKQLHGRWSPRVAELDVNGELKIYKSVYNMRRYDLKSLDNVCLKAGEDNIQAKLSFDDGKKLHLKLKGPDRAEWSKRMTQNKFPSCRPDQTLAYKPPATVCNIYDFVQQSPQQREKVEEVVPSPRLYPVTPVPKPRSMFQLLAATSTTIGSTQDYSPMPVHLEDDSYVTKMARVFEPSFVNRRQTLHRT